MNRKYACKSYLTHTKYRRMHILIIKCKITMVLWNKFDRVISISMQKYKEISYEINVRCKRKLNSLVYSKAYKINKWITSYLRYPVNHPTALQQCTIICTITTPPFSSMCLFQMATTGITCVNSFDRFHR
jgi:hypothetical protein